MNQTFQTKRTPEEIILHYLQLPFKNVESFVRHMATQEEPYKATEVLQRLAI